MTQVTPDDEPHHESAGELVHVAGWAMATAVDITGVSTPPQSKERRHPCSSNRIQGLGQRLARPSERETAVESALAVTHEKPSLHHFGKLNVFALQSAVAMTSRKAQIAALRRGRSAADALPTFRLDKLTWTHAAS